MPDFTHDPVLAHPRTPLAQAGSKAPGGLPPPISNPGPTRPGGGNRPSTLAATAGVLFLGWLVLK